MDGMPASSNSYTRKKSPRVCLRKWLPGQPGAVMMAMSPALAGAVASWCRYGWSAASWWLTVCWLLCYCVQFSAARWFKSHGRRRWLAQPLAYGAALCGIGLPFVVRYPGILVWAPPMAVLAAVSFIASWRREERSLWSNAVAVIAACLMSMLTFHYGQAPSPSVPRVDGTGALLACAFGVVQFGSVLFVKTMIRERGSGKYLAASWAWHVLAVFAAVLEGKPSLIALSAILLARAIAMPLVSMKRTVKPLHTGLTELASSLLALATIIAAAV